MCTHEGKLFEDDFKYCRIDYFKDVEGVKFFFLTHYHTDHIKGINDIIWCNNEFRLYCSEITKGFIERSKWLDIPSQQIYPLENNKPEYIFHENECIKVTSLSAGHCPGSIMLLFESYCSRVLHTGDYRLSIADLKLAKPLHKDGKIIKLNNLYLDTTFAKEIYESFITRDKSFELIKTIINRSKMLNNTNYTVFLPSANIGYEHIMIELYNEYKKPIHISNDSYERFFSHLLPLENILTLEDDKTDIHFCKCVGKCWPCPLNTATNRILHIKPCALIFTKITLSMNEDYMVNYDRYEHINNIVESYKVLYATHSSLNELKEFVNYLKPEKITPLVVDKNSSEEQIVNLLTS